MAALPALKGLSGAVCAIWVVPRLYAVPLGCETAPFFGFLSRFIK
jgi:hypothetical protein